MTAQAVKECIACDGVIPRLRGAILKRFSKKLGGGWKVIKSHHLEKEFTFKNFREALAFTNKVGKLAERIQHHPDIYLAWGKVRLTIWTHSVGGLTENDFIIAAKVEKL